MKSVYFNARGPMAALVILALFLGILDVIERMAEAVL